jgi:hypothetical protein
MKDTRGWFRRWLAAWYGSLMEGSRLSTRMSNTDWAGWRVD